MMSRIGPVPAGLFINEFNAHINKDSGCSILFNILPIEKYIDLVTDMSLPVHEKYSPVQLI